jgi:hypothetical protein
MHIDYNDRHFRSVASTGGGDVDGDTCFHYRQVGDVVWATYHGGGVAFGTLTAAVLPDGTLDMRYQQVSRNGTIKTGRCVSTPEVLPDGRLRLHESWRWTEGGDGAGESRIEEMPPSAGPDGDVQPTVGAQARGGGSAPSPLRR